jgi:hypothetical protein
MADETEKTDIGSVSSSGSYTGLQWRDGPPAGKGLYLYRRDPQSRSRGCKVEEHQKGKLIMYLTGYEVPIQVDSAPDTAQWAGPIPEPIPIDEAESAE